MERGRSVVGVGKDVAFGNHLNYGLNAICHVQLVLVRGGEGKGVEEKLYV